MNKERTLSEAPSPMKVFIVEDSLNMQAALKELVCAVVDAQIVGVVASEALALDWAKSNAGGWELAIVDLTLEQGDGFNIVRCLKQQEQGGAVVVFSAFVTDVIRRHCQALGADAIFHKTESNELARYVEELAGSALTS
jgi:two-component system OmpR family response regulator